MPPEALAAATARRHELTRAKAIQALRELDRAGAPVTFASVAATAGISRSWLYTQPDLRGQIQELRAAAPPGPAPPARQRASDPSLRARLTVALDRNRQLAEENTRLRRQLARALGDQLSARLQSGNDQPRWKRHDNASHVSPRTVSSARRRGSQPRLTRKLKITNALGMAGQVAYHLMAQAGMTRAPWAVTTLVSCLPVLVLGMGTALAHMLCADAEALDAPDSGTGPPITVRHLSWSHQDRGRPDRTRPEMGGDQSPVRDQNGQKPGL